ncbi:MAG: hypothetical protein WC968_00750 [Bacilli bacterium]|jgi:hypothetical protein
MEKLNYSMKAYLHLADEVGIHYFNQIKNHLLAYPGVKVAYSWKFERFSHGGETAVKLTIQGRTLNIFYNLSLDDIDTDHYHVSDKRGAKMHQATPVAFKVRGPRQLKYALELIDLYFRKKGVVQGNVATINYKLPTLSKEELIKKRLIKIVRGNQDYRKR